MITHLAAVAANCNTGSWQQKWSCGWHRPPSQAAMSAGNFAGHNLTVAVIGLFTLWLLFRAARRRSRAAAGRVSQGRG